MITVSPDVYTKPTDSVTVCADPKSQPSFHPIVRRPLAVKRDSNFISPAFSSLAIPEIRPKKVVKRINEKLPKALTGNDALNMFRAREEKKKAELVAKENRKREQKKKEKVDQLERKRLEREALKQKQIKMKALKKHTNTTRRAGKAESDSSSDEDKNVKVSYADSDDSCDESNVCPACHSDDGHLYEWINCTKCPRKWHITCTGDALLLEIPRHLRINYPFYCEYCLK